MPGRAELAAGALLGLVLAAPAWPAEPVPDAGFLEFLGLLLEDHGDYLDPLDMVDISLPAVDGQQHDAPDDLRPDDEQARLEGGAAAENDDE